VGKPGVLAAITWDLAVFTAMGRVPPEIRSWMKFADAGFPVPGRESVVEMKRRFPVPLAGKGVNFRRTPSSYGPHFEPQIAQISQIDLPRMTMDCGHCPWFCRISPYSNSKIRVICVICGQF